MSHDVFPLRGVTYSEFDNIVGPQLRYMYPPDAITPEAFESLSHYVIVGKHLYNKIITVKTESFQFVNYAAAIENVKYERNTLLFSFGFVLSEEADTEPFEPILRKLSSTLIAMEVESSFLFQPTSKSQLPGFLKELYEDLVSKGESLLAFDASNFFAVKILREPKHPSLVNLFDVPILCYEISSLSNLPWDISLQHLIAPTNLIAPQIDGISYVKNISNTAHMDVDYVCRGLQILLLYKCIILSDVFKFSNVYELVPQSMKFLKEGNPIMMECLAFSSLQRKSIPGNLSDRSPTTLNLIRVLLCLRPEKDLAKLLLTEPSMVSNLRGLDFRRLLAIAQHYNIIRRKHEYPCYPTLNNNLPITSTSSNNDFLGLTDSSDNPDDRLVKKESKDSSVISWLSHLDGSRCLDDICCEFGVDPKLILQHPGIIVIYK